MLQWPVWLGVESGQLGVYKQCERGGLIACSHRGFWSTWLAWVIVV